MSHPTYPSHHRWSIFPRTQNPSGSLSPSHSALHGGGIPSRCVLPFTAVRIQLSGSLAASTCHLCTEQGGTLCKDSHRTHDICCGERHIRALRAGAFKSTCAPVLPGASPHYIRLCTDPSWGLASLYKAVQPRAHSSLRNHQQDLTPLSLETTCAFRAHLGLSVGSALAL